MVMVKKIMHKNLMVVHEGDGVELICRTLIKSKLSGLPVVDKKKKLVGFVSEKDVIAAVGKSGSKNFFKKTAKDLMRKNVKVVEDDTSADQVARIFSEKPFRHLPVVKNGKLVGMVERKFVINHLLGHYY